ncbi:hypothetical protein DPMN_165158 [Dreissena polymorpha]|uniref:Uncharacterized protein n=1 Tax=Dreissena polymorpha TaxID=45954 RepID=A0A9D4IW43_DREPO|nr:hypothetical protein DPMN_165158 [Dreissena polymorpha]
MYNEANRQNIPQGERYGRIIFDEIEKQTDIQSDKHGDIVDISGFTDYGNEGDSCFALNQGSSEKSQENMLTNFFSWEIMVFDSRLHFSLPMVYRHPSYMVCSGKLYIY